MFHQKGLCKDVHMQQAKGKIGLIGTGKRLRRVLSHVINHADGNQIEVVSAFDPDEGSMNDLRKLLGYDFHQAASEDEVISNPAIDWIFIGSWNCYHTKQAIKALKAGKHVFCEKPLATTLEDCLAIRDAVEQSGKIFFFGLVLRYSSHYRTINEIVQSGRLGRILSFEFNETLAFNHGGYIFGGWRRNVEYSGSHMLEKCCHDLDIANWILNSYPVKAASFGGNDFFIANNDFYANKIGLSKDGLPAYCGWTDPHRVNPFSGETNILDNQVVILEYANGTRGTFHTNCNSAIPERRLYLCGTEGSLRADLHRKSVEWCRIGWDEKISAIDTGSTDLHGGGDQVMAAALVRTMFFGERPLASVSEGLHSAIAAFGIDLAVESGNTVDLTPFWNEAEIDLSHNSNLIS